MIELLPEETLHDLPFGNNKLIQNKNLFCYGIDAVLLSDFAKTKHNSKVLDLCTGNGIIPLLMESLSKNNIFTGIEIQQSSVELANRSIELNNLQNKISIIQGDLKNIKELIPGNFFNVVTVNPPFAEVNQAIKNPSESLAIARHEVLCTIDDVVAAAAYAIAPGGVFYMIHRPNRLNQIFLSLDRNNFKPSRIRFVHPDTTKAPNMVLIEAHKDCNRQLKIEAPMFVYKSKGVYTEEIQKIYNQK